MTVKPTISLTDQAYEFAKSLVETGKFASMSAVLQRGLQLVQREEEEHEARLAAIRTELAQRATQPSISTDDMDARLATWRARRDAPDVA
jgi:antitoxin ParD1/3/4